ncbi:MAG: GHMP kinase, partial [Armatimonadetes bacterium]|nr:GHMP kinase [Armatimonadota bacterium]
MIITQTPLRISFAGGGTDFEGFYRDGGGCVVSTAIDKYIYVIIKERFDDKIRVGYSKTEMVDSVDEIEHELVRECLRKTGITSGVEISTMADIPSEGSGLGSSSTVTVGLLNAMYAYQGEIRPADILADEACDIEINVLGKPIGKQDQYIAAFGSMRLIEFRSSGAVDVSPVEIGMEKRHRLGESVMLFYTGVTRKADVILSQQKANIEDKRRTLETMRQQAYDLRESLLAGDLDAVGRTMHAGWLLKKQLANNISNGHIDEIYQAAVEAGALGG